MTAAMPMAMPSPVRKLRIREVRKLEVVRVKRSRKYMIVIPAQAGIQLVEQAPRSGTKPNCILNNGTGFRPAPE